MPGYLRQSTASQGRALGPFLDDTDFKTAETALTIANTDIKLVANGGASANKNSGGGTHRVNGVYGVTFDATDTATVGELQVSVVVSGALPVFDKFFVIEEAVYDALVAASAPGYLQPTTAGRTLDVTATGEAGIDWANIGAPTTTVNLSGTSTKAVEPTVSGRTLDVTATGEAGIDWANIGAPTTTQNLSGTTIAAVNGAVGSVTGAVGSVTGNVGGNVTGSVGSVTGAVGSVTGNVGGNVVGSVGSVTGAVGSVTGNVGGNVTGAVGSVTGNVGGNVTGSVGSVAAGGITAASIATGAIDADALAPDAVDEIWDEVVEGVITARQSLRLANAANGGKLAGAATTTITIRDVSDTLTRVTATVDADGNRTAVALNL